MIDPPPSLQAVKGLEERALRAWPALETLPCRGWQVRFAGGYTKRSNSANALAPSSGFERVKPMVEIFYRSHHQPVIFRLTPLAGEDVDPVLEKAGYALVDPTLVMAAKLPDEACDASVVLSERPSEAWSHGVASASALPSSHAAIHARIVEAIPAPKIFATLMDEDEPLAFGVAVADRGMVGLFDIVVTKAARRRGVGRRIAKGLMAWGRSRGAVGAYLQVTATNSAAIALYGDLGFEEIYRYHYRVAA
jgi:ribosomal protein S18 acetylase RimI-like enzyme